MDYCEGCGRGWRRDLEPDSGLADYTVRGQWVFTLCRRCRVWHGGVLPASRDHGAGADPVSDGGAVMCGACLNCGVVIPDAVALFCSAACWYAAVLLQPGGQR